jgi:LysM repeat protein
MKISKIFGFVLSLHLGVITVLIMQPGCRTTQPPTHTYQQSNGATESKSIKSTVWNSGDGLIPVTREDSSLDSAFNSGFKGNSDGRYAPQRPTNEFSEFEDIAPLEPVVDVSTVAVAGESFEAYTVIKGDSLWAIAKRKNVSLSELYVANGLNQSSVLNIGQQIQVPVEGGAGIINTVTADTYQPSGDNMTAEAYTVKGGDTLSKIAKKYDTTVRAIQAANAKSSDIIRVGEKLVIPVGESSTGSTAVTPAVKSRFVASTAPSSINTNGTHTVRAGEYPATIARQYGMTASELLAVNGITDPRKLQVGQKLKVSTTGSAANVDSQTATIPTSVVAVRSNAIPVVSAADNGPVEIRVIEADPLVENESAEINTDSLFENAVETPVIRMEAQR